MGYIDGAPATAQRGPTLNRPALLRASALVDLPAHGRSGFHCYCRLQRLALSGPLRSRTALFDGHLSFLSSSGVMSARRFGARSNIIPPLDANLPLAVDGHASNCSAACYGTKRLRTAALCDAQRSRDRADASRRPRLTNHNILATRSTASRRPRRRPSRRPRLTTRADAPRTASTRRDVRVKFKLSFGSESDLYHVFCGTAP